MPSYQVASQSQRNVQQAVPGLPAYLLGSLNRTVAPTIMNVTQVQLTSPTAQVTGTVIEGQIPVAGQLVSITGAAPSYFNVTNATITAVSAAAAAPDVGVYTISFTLTNSNIPTTNSPGKAVAPQVEVGEAVVAGASAQVSIQENVNPANGKSVRCDVSFPTAAGSCTVKVQTAMHDVDTEYQDAGTVATMTGGVVTGGSLVLANMEALFVRLKNSAVAGASTAKIVGKVTI